MKKLKETIKAGLKDMGNDALRAWGVRYKVKDTKDQFLTFLKKGNRMKRVKSFFKGYMRAIEINAALMYGYRPK